MIFGNRLPSAVLLIFKLKVQVPVWVNVTICLQNDTWWEYKRMFDVLRRSGKNQAQSFILVCVNFCVYVLYVLCDILCKCHDSLYFVKAVTLSGH